jgi:SAM-dependent methyltransferase
LESLFDCCREFVSIGFNDFEYLGVVAVLALSKLALGYLFRTEKAFAHVEGHGMNERELEANDRLDGYFLRDLNEDPSFPLPDRAFDSVLNAVSIQYLQYPGPVFSEIHRVLRPGGLVIVSFSNRMFFTKAIRAWRSASNRERVDLVKRYVESVDGFCEPTAIVEAEPGRDPFFAVIAHCEEDS